MNIFFCLAAWSLVSLILLNISAFVRDLIANTQRMYQIPCANCQFFTGSPYLKCTLHPTIALSEEAINCRDYL